MSWGFASERFCEPFKSALTGNPGLAKTVYDSFCQAKGEAVKGYERGYIFNNAGLMFPGSTV